MPERVAIIGVGQTVFRTTTPELSYKELMFEAATKAYEDAGNLNPRKDIDSFVSVSEDFWEGTSIFDEYVPDQLGGAQRPVHTVGGDGLHGLIAAYMQIRTGLIDTCVVEAHSKASDILTFTQVLAFAMDPIYNRPLRFNPHVMAGLEMMRFLNDTGNTKKHCASVVVKNRRNALLNPFAAYGANLSVEDVLCSEPMFMPLQKLDMSERADGCVVLVLAAERLARKYSREPIWIAGAGWCSDSFSFEMRELSTATYARMAAEMAYKQAKLKNPAKEIDVAEIDDTFSYKELQHFEALKLCKPGASGKLTLDAVTTRDGNLPVNPSGGSLGCGHALDATGLMRAAEIVRQLRSEAGKVQVSGAELGLVQSWRGIPTATGAVVILRS